MGQEPECVNRISTASARNYGTGQNGSGYGPVIAGANNRFNRPDRPGLPLCNCRIEANSTGLPVFQFSLIPELKSAARMRRNAHGCVLGMAKTKSTRVGTHEFAAKVISNR